MDKEKKKELAEMDSRWNFEKEIKYGYDKDWEYVKNLFNNIQDSQGDLYMEVSKLPMPGRLDRLKLKYREFKGEEAYKVTIHHRQIYDWFLRLANHLDMQIGEAIYMCDKGLQQLRQELDLGDTMTVEINSVEEMAEPEESKVSKDELEEMIDNEQ